MKYILSITILIILTGCAGNSPEIYQSGDSKTCTYDKIEGKSFKYAGESQYTLMYLFESTAPQIPSGKRMQARGEL